ncbi:hypothetical protein QVD17_28100 [Tagetes erecta]|uniref:DRBM domain-containing protein n=1 Tax=Tagetes erecta TaxID=13708 RepID=A0AAD8KEG3_TARER|nr:hypothetical protein QVD17_28100 [Tagetes erecta]
MCILFKSKIKFVFSINISLYLRTRFDSIRLYKRTYVCLNKYKSIRKLNCKGVMDIEAGPTEEIVNALLEYLVGPLLPLKHSEIASETPSEVQQKSVAKQVHAAAVLYNYFHLNHHKESQTLKFDQFCNLTLMFRPSILRHMKYVCQSDHPLLDDPENQLSLTEKAIVDACTMSKTLLNASHDISNVVKEWPITKVAVLLIDLKKENCFLNFNNGVWSVIEKDLYPESKKRKRTMINLDEEGDAGFQKLAFSAVKEVTGIVHGKLKVLESSVVYSLSQAKTATLFYIVQSTQSVGEENLVPIQDVICSLQGPVVKECTGSWVVTPVVEYYYLLPYAEIISKLFSSASNSLPHTVEKRNAESKKVSEENQKVSDDLQMKSKPLKKSYKKVTGDNKKVSDDLQMKSKPSQTSCEKVSAENKNVFDDLQMRSKPSQKLCEKVNGSDKKVSDDLQVKSKPDLESVNVSKSSKEAPHDRKFTKNTSKSKNSSNEVVTSRLIGAPFDQEVKETKISTDDNIMDTLSDSTKGGMNGINGSCRDVSNDSSSGANNKSFDRSLMFHEKKSTPTKSISSKQNLKHLKKMSTISQSKDERVDCENKSYNASPEFDKTFTVNHALEDFCSKADSKGSELSEAALRALLNKRQKLYHQQEVIEGELTLCDKKIQAIMDGGIGDCLNLKLEAIIDCCNELGKQDNVQTKRYTNLHGVRSSSSLPGKSLSEAQLTLRKACQELDDICLSNNWMLPTYHMTLSHGGVMANVTVKGTNFECSGVSGIQLSIHEARNSAATSAIMRLQQMASEMNMDLV